MSERQRLDQFFGKETLPRFFNPSEHSVGLDFGRYFDSLITTKNVNIDTKYIVTKLMIIYVNWWFYGSIGIHY